MADDKLLEEINEDYEYSVTEWREIYKAGDDDMKYIAGDPWPQAEKEARSKAGRPCLCLDELSQYVSQRCNDLRQNKRAVKLAPAGGGANDKTAELKADIIRTIESKGGLQAYIHGYECAIERGFGFWVVGKRYVEYDSFDQELYIRIIRNPKTVVIDPDAKEPAASDMKYAFIIDSIPKKQYTKKFPRAEITDFSSELAISHPLWFKSDHITVCEAWRVVTKSARLLLVGDKANPQKFFEADLPKEFQLANGGITLPNGMVLPILRERRAERREVRQYIVNGVEVLEKHEWEGKWIPVVPCFGREYWLDEGTGDKRKIESLIRKSKCGQMLHNYIGTAKMEAIGQVLKAPYQGYEGQFEGHEEEWKYANRAPLPYLEVKPTVEALPGVLLPLPQRNFNQPEIQSYEIADESAKRSIQNGMGMYNASVGKQDSSAKSGIAIKALDLQSDQGNYHFIDNFDTAIQQTGRILEDMIQYVYDTERDLLLRKPDESHKNVRINTEQPVIEDGKPVTYDTKHGIHEVTVSVGPSYQSAREMASEFVDLLVQNIDRMPIQPELKGKLLALSITLKQLGPIGDEMVEMLDPKPEDGQQTQIKAQQLQQLVMQLTEANNKLLDEREAKTVELQAQNAAKQAEIESRERIAKLQSATTLEVEHMKLTAQADIMAIKNDLAILQANIKAIIDTRALEQKGALEARGQDQNAAIQERQLQQQGYQAEQQNALAARAQQASEQQAAMAAKQKETQAQA